MFLFKFGILLVRKDSTALRAHSTEVPTHACLFSSYRLCFDTTSLSSLESLVKWLRIVYEKSQRIPIVIFSNKSDLPKVVAETDIQNCAAKLIAALTEYPDMRPIAGFYCPESPKIPLFYGSAKTGQGVEPLFKFLAEKLPRPITHQFEIEPVTISRSRQGGFCCR